MDTISARCCALSVCLRDAMRRRDGYLGLYVLVRPKHKSLDEERKKPPSPRSALRMLANPTAAAARKINKHPRNTCTRINSKAKGASYRSIGEGGKMPENESGNKP
ncbi:hypothetical protein U1Q18_050969 [Sarracenia purpurea var. burkii]